MPRIRSTSGRHDLARVPDPAAGYPVLPRSANNRPATIAPVAVADAYDGRRRVRALARVDLLDRERRADRIGEAAYLAGREVERTFERMARIGGGGQWLQGDKIDGASTAEIAVVLGLENAVLVNSFLRWLVRHLGRRDARLLWAILGEGKSFVQMGVAWGYAGNDGAHYVGNRFRDALGALAEAKAARGRACHD